MPLQRRRIVVLGAAALALVALVPADHRANIEILTHRAGDLDPQRLQAGLDFGLVAVSVLVTWSRKLPY